MGRYSGLGPKYTWLYICSPGGKAGGWASYKLYDRGLSDADGSAFGLCMSLGVCPRVCIHPFRFPMWKHSYPGQALHQGFRINKPERRGSSPKCSGGCCRSDRYGLGLHFRAYGFLGGVWLLRICSLVEPDVPQTRGGPDVPAPHALPT